MGLPILESDNLAQFAFLISAVAFFAPKACRHYNVADATSMR